jgi:SAM-dependent methyltransferase
MPESTRTVRRYQADRLVYYSQQADPSYWHNRWEARLKRDDYQAALAGRFEYLESLFQRWLPRDAPILEAGCGRGQLVLALRVQGWSAEGVDYSAETIEAVTRLFPELPLSVGDVTSLDAADGHYGGYISIGVVEHRREGPEPFLEEAFRVLRPGGIAVITVPYLNPIRRVKARSGFYRGAEPDLPFYQYAFSEPEICRYLQQAGFEIVDRQPYGGYKGIIDELPLVRPFLGAIKKAPLTGPPTRRWLDHCRFGHMLALVGRKPDR